jgi:hypothetical protein
MSCACKSRQWFGEHVGHHLVSGEVPQPDCPMFRVVLKEVPLWADVFCLLEDQGILGVRDGALAVLRDGGCSGDGGVECLLPP